MAFEGFQGQQSQNMYGNGGYSPSVYGYSFSNSESTIDKTNLSFGMWKTTLQIRIAPLVESGTEFHIDRKNSVAIFLIPAKAKMFADILRKYKEDPEKMNNYGVASGKSLITVMSPKAFKKDSNGCIINIRNITPEGVVEASYSYETKSTYNTVSGYDDKNGSFSQDFKTYETLEIDLIITQLEEYVKAMTNTYAFANVMQMYPYADKIASKLGVDLTNGYGGNNYRAQSYFNSSNSSGHQQQSAPQQVQGGLSSLIEN